jgi:4-alpha-glucanotransferase
MTEPLPQPSPPLDRLAAAVGLHRHWRDVDGQDQRVSDACLTAILAALGYPSDTGPQLATSLARAEAPRRDLPRLLIGEMGLPTPLPLVATRAAITGPDGVTTPLAIVDGHLAPIAEPGYYDLDLDGAALRLAIAPHHCPLPAPQDRRLWGTAVQIPALRGPVDQGFGTFGDLALAVESLGHHGAGAVAINPVHALFPGTGTDFSPYSPSSRQFLNTAMGDPALLGLAPLPPHAASDLIDWPAALPARFADLRACFAELTAEQRATIARANAAEGPALHRHALFDALDCHFRPTGADGWQAWPAAYHDPAGPAASQFAADHAEELEFHLFAQWLARTGLEQVQDRAKASGMAIGLIADLAVGVRPTGSDSWAMPEAMLRGLTIGAPPDPLGPLGQNWGITAFSPHGLRDTGYAPFIAMLRAALRSAGGLRIDHAFGLARLWVIPEGADSSQGAYLDYPFLDLIRLVTLEAHLAGALIIAEDLGTSPHGFTQAIATRHMPGMRVLWFERAADSGFIGAQDYPPLSVAMTGTHDTATVAGWWSGRDLDWADRLGRLPAGTTRAMAEDARAWDRGLLWATIGDGGARPSPDDPQPVVDAAVAHIARSPALLAIAPLEDLLGMVEQPNLPGTTVEHPNWQRRLPAPLDSLLDAPGTRRRIDRLSLSVGPDTND